MIRKILWLCVFTVFTGGAANAADLAEMMPESTLLYVGWPGMHSLSETAKDTSFAKLMNEPEMLRFRQTWREKLWPSIIEKMKEEMQKEGEIPPVVFDALMDLSGTACKYPTAFGIAGVAMSQDGPQVDVAMIIRAGQESAHLIQLVDALIELANKNGPGIEVKEVEAVGTKWKEFMLPEPPIPIRYGLLGDDFIFTIGKKVPEHLGAAGSSASLAKSERFTAAMKTTGGSASTPVVYLDVQSIMATLETFRPLMAEVPIVGEEGGIQKLMDGLGLGKLESISVAAVPEAGGFKTTCFIHAPGMSEGIGKSFIQKPLTNDDLKSVPKDAGWATVTNFDLVGFYNGILDSIQKLSPPTHAQVIEAIEGGEKSAGLSIRDDVFGAFGDTWVFFDAPSNGSFLFTGITLVTEATKENKLESALQSVIGLIGMFTGNISSMSLEQEEYRARKIVYLNVKSLPIPVAPAWAEYEGKRIVAFYPQMVRITLDRLMDHGDSLLDNPDFQRARKLMPPNASSISYVDTVACMRTIYSIALPVSQALIAMGQGEGVLADPTLLPAWPTIARHLFGDISATAEIENGIVTVSHGPLPVNMGGAVMGMAMGSSLSVLLSTWINPLAVVELGEVIEQSEEMEQEEDLTGVSAIAKACLVYAESHRGKLPADLETLTEGGDQAYLQPDQFKSSRDQTGSDVSYIYLAGQMNTFDPRNVLVYEDPDKVQGDTLAVGFLDGHARTVDREELEELVTETKERLAELEQQPPPQPK